MEYANESVDCGQMFGYFMTFSYIFCWLSQIIVQYLYCRIKHIILLSLSTFQLLAHCYFVFLMKSLQGNLLRHKRFAPRDRLGTCRTFYFFKAHCVIFSFLAFSFS